MDVVVAVGPPAGVWPLSLGAYYAYLPDVMTGNAEPSFGQNAFVLSMTMWELILPLLVVGGLLARLSAALLIAQVWIASLSSGQLFGTGRLFDASPFDPGPDQLVLWSLVLIPVAIHGAGPISFDALAARLRAGRT